MTDEEHFTLSALVMYPARAYEIHTSTASYTFAWAAAFLSGRYSGRVSSRVLSYDYGTSRFLHSIGRRT
nr:hypothetical protein CFP56_44474 [Quercus suber]